MSKSGTWTGRSGVRDSGGEGRAHRHRQSVVEPQSTDADWTTERRHTTHVLSDGHSVR
jgi:hypothetical protein